MNLCVVSTFDCTVDEFKAMVQQFEDQLLGTAIAAYEIGVVDEHKVMTMADVTDMDAFQAVMSSPEMTAWDAANNCVDVVYALEQIN